MPDDVVFVESLPHTATGKLLKTELRARIMGTSRSADRRSSLAAVLVRLFVRSGRLLRRCSSQ